MLAQLSMSEGHEDLLSRSVNALAARSMSLLLLPSGSA
jgi:hypothetical protein